MLRYVQESYYNTNLPSWVRPGEHRESQYFKNQYFLFEKDVYDRLLTLAKAPSYLRKMRENGVPLKIEKKEFLIVSRFSDLGSKTVMDLAAFYERTFKAPEHSTQDPLILWENYSSDDVEERTLVSNIWRLYFDKPFVPYNRAKRIRSQKGVSVGIPQ